MAFSFVVKSIRTGTTKEYLGQSEASAEVKSEDDALLDEIHSNNEVNAERLNEATSRGIISDLVSVVHLWRFSAEDITHYFGTDEDGLLVTTVTQTPLMLVLLQRPSTGMGLG